MFFNIFTTYRMARKLHHCRTEIPYSMASKHSRLSRKSLISTLVGVTALSAFALPAGAATIPSPLRYVRQPGYVVERAADASERLLDLDLRGLARLRAVSEKESVTLQTFPFGPGATGALVLERFEVASPEGRTLIEGAAGETSAPLPRGVHFEGHLEGEPGSRVYLGAPGDFVVAILQTSAGIVYVGPDGPASGPVQHVVRRSDSPRNAEFAQLDEVGGWWHANRPTSSYPRTLVQYLSGKPVTGGIAWLTVLCANDFSQSGGHWGGAYGVVQINGAYPASPWDLIASAHEMGHN